MFLFPWHQYLFQILQMYRGAKTPCSIQVFESVLVIGKCIIPEVSVVPPTNLKLHFAISAEGCPEDEFKYLAHARPITAADRNKTIKAIEDNKYKLIFFLFFIAVPI